MVARPFDKFYLSKQQIGDHYMKTEKKKVKISEQTQKVEWNSIYKRLFMLQFICNEQAAYTHSRAETVARVPFTISSICSIHSIVYSL